jgi:hypothetical protein
MSETLVVYQYLYHCHEVLHLMKDGISSETQNKPEATSDATRRAVPSAPTCHAGVAVGRHDTRKESARNDGLCCSESRQR